MLNENTIYSLHMYGTMEGSVPFIMDNSHVYPFIKISVEKVKNPTTVPLLYYHVCPKYLRIYKSLYEYCVSHELLIRETSGFKRNDYS